MKNTVYTKPIPTEILDLPISNEELEFLINFVKQYKFSEIYPERNYENAPVKFYPRIPIKQKFEREIKENLTFDEMGVLRNKLFKLLMFSTNPDARNLLGRSLHKNFNSNNILETIQLFAENKIIENYDKYDYAFNKNNKILNFHDQNIIVKQKPITISLLLEKIINPSILREFRFARENTDENYFARDITVLLLDIIIPIRFTNYLLSNN